MVNPFNEVDWNPNVTARRSFAKSLVIGFPLVALLALVILRVKSGQWESRVPLLIFGCGAGLGIIFWIIPQVAKPFYIVWYVLACCIGFVVGNLLFGGVYYVLVTGLGLGMKLVGRDPLCRRVDRNARTYWLDMEQPKDKKRYFNQY